MKKSTKTLIRNIVLAVLGIGLLVGAASMIASCIKQEDDGFDKVNPTFTIGALDEEGAYVKDSKNALYTSKGLEVNPGDEVRITMDFESDVYYQLFYYTNEDDLVKANDISRNTNVYVVPEEVELVRIMILPYHNSDLKEEEQKIGLFDIAKYTTQLSVEVKRVEETEPEILKFIIKYGQGVSETFDFEDGMTWGQWLESEYCINKSNFNISEDGYFTYAGNNTNKYYLTDLIEATTYENSI